MSVKRAKAAAAAALPIVAAPVLLTYMCRFNLKFNLAGELPITKDPASKLTFALNANLDNEWKKEFANANIQVREPGTDKESITFRNLEATLLDFNRFLYHWFGSGELKKRFESHVFGRKLEMSITMEHIHPSHSEFATAVEQEYFDMMERSPLAKKIEVLTAKVDELIAAKTQKRTKKQKVEMEEKVVPPFETKKT